MREDAHTPVHANDSPRNLTFNDRQLFGSGNKHVSATGTALSVTLFRSMHLVVTLALQNLNILRHPTAKILRIK